MKHDGPDQTAPSADGRSSRWARHRAQRRLELLRSARSAVDELGAQASMEEIATACRTSKSVYYRYFGDKAGLQRAVGEYTVARMRHRLEDAARAAGTFEGTVEAMVAEYLLGIERSASVYRFVVALSADPGKARPERHRADRSRGERPGPDAPGGPERHHLIQEFVESVTALLAEAHVRHSPAEHRLAEPLLGYWAASTIGMVRGAGEAWMNTPAGTQRPSRERMTELVVGWAVNGLRPSGTPDAPARPSETAAGPSTAAASGTADAPAAPDRPDDQDPPDTRTLTDTPADPDLPDPRTLTDTPSFPDTPNLPDSPPGARPDPAPGPVTAPVTAGPPRQEQP